LIEPIDDQSILVDAMMGRLCSWSLAVAFLATIGLALALTSGEIAALKDMQAEWPSLGWTGPPSCFWTNVICDPQQNVIQLFLAENKLSGTIPASIGNFFQLRFLYVCLFLPINLSIPPIHCLIVVVGWLELIQLLVGSN
jgi:hypothetical protein